jgi:hypothetical protein
MKTVFKNFTDVNDGNSYSKCYPNLFEWLKVNYNSFSDQNIEEVLTYLDYLKNEFTISESSKFFDIPKIYSELINYLQELLNHSNNPKDLKLHLQLVRKIKPDDSIISFNYDEIIDFALIDYNKKIKNKTKLPQLLNLQYLISRTSFNNSLFKSIGIERCAQSGSGVLLKLHGSLFWNTCTKIDCPNRFFINMSNEVNKIDSEVAYYQNPGFDMLPHEPLCCGLCGSKVESVFIYPSAYKQFSDFPKIKVLWQEAFRVLNSATHYVIIGYSLPETDWHVKNLIRQACYRDKGRSWRIVDPNWKDVLKRLKPLIQGQTNSVTFYLKCYTTFSNYLRNKNVAEDYVDDYFLKL